MAFPLVAVYYVVLIIGSILFLQVYDQDRLIEGGQNVLDKIASQKESLLSSIAPYVEEATEKIHQQFYSDKQDDLAGNTINVVRNNDLVKKLYYIYNHAAEQFDTSIIGQYLCRVYAWIEQFIAEHPVICETKSKVFEHVHKCAEIIYDFSSEKLTSMVQQEPFQSCIAEYGKLHDQYVTPYVECTSEYVSGYMTKSIEFLWEKVGTENTNANTNTNFELTYTFFIIIVAVFICKLTLTKILKIFVKDAFQMNRSVSDMYKGSLTCTTHSPIYETIKEKSEHAMVVDELEEVEAEEAEEEEEEAKTATLSNGSNRNISGSNRNIPGSNRSTAGSNRRHEEEQEEQEEEQEEKLELGDVLPSVTPPPSSPSSQPRTSSLSVSSAASSFAPPVQPPGMAPTTTQADPVTATGRNV